MKRIVFLTAMFLIIGVSVFANEDIWVVKPVGSPSEYGYQEYGIFDSDGNSVEPAEREREIELLANPLPERYSSVEQGFISPVKNQGIFGTCWAHAFVACAETSMIKKGYEKNFVDFSEAHTAYFFHKKDATQGDGTDHFDTNGLGYFGAGNSFAVAKVATNNQGVVSEWDVPYNSISADVDFSIDESLRYRSDVYLHHYGYVRNEEDVKQAIMEYGAVTASYNHVNECVMPNGAYFCNNGTNTNHEVVVVGWDDNYSRENFSEDRRPSCNGAWLIKNSHSLSCGDFGYMWISYQEPSFRGNIFLDFELTDKVNKVHSYNGDDGNLYWRIPAANVFCADGDQTLHSVGFEAVTGGNIIPQKYNVNIYVFNSKPSSPVSLSPKASLSGRILHDGFIRAELSNPIELKDGQYFSVVVELFDDQGNVAPILFESNEEYTSGEGQTYVKGGYIWADTYGLTVSGYDVKNAMIKAYSEKNGKTVHFNTKGHGEIEPQTVYESNKIKKPEDPSYEGYEFLGWYTNITATEQWDFSKPAEHNMTLYAKWSEPQNVEAKTMSHYYSEEYTPRVKVCGDGIEEYVLCVRAENGRWQVYEGYGADKLNKWWSLNKNIGKYKVFAVGKGANGECVTTETITYEVTTEPVIDVGDEYTVMMNIPEEGATMYIAQYEDDGRLISVQKYTQVPDGLGLNTSSYYVAVPTDTDLKNPRYYMWNKGMTTPLCVAK